MHCATDTSPSLSWFRRIDFSSSLMKFVAIFALCVGLYCLRPASLSSDAWLVFSIFVSTIVAIVLKPLPMGALSIVAAAALVATHTVKLSTILDSFSNDLIWLIVMSCFLARAFIKTGLGRRIAYEFLRVCGGTPLGLGYGFLFSASLMAPLIPSTTARTGGIILPVLRSTIQVLGQEQKVERIAEFLTLLVMNSSVITSCMFLTSNGGNPIAVKFAKSFGVSIDFATWAMAASVPAIASLLLLPLLLKWFLPCTLDNPKLIVEHARKELTEMGPVSSGEKITIATFGLLLVLWSFGAFFNIHPTEAALIGVGVLLVAKVLSWHEVLAEELAWDTFFWMAILIMMASELQGNGVIDFFTKSIVSVIPNGHWSIAFAAMAFLYFYSHYFFASTTAHLTSMFVPFVGVLCSLGAPPVATCFAFAFMTNLFGGLTQYSSGPSPIVFATGYVDFKKWIRIGFITSIFYIIVWLGGGFLWWKFLNLY